MAMVDSSAFAGKFLDSACFERASNLLNGPTRLESNILIGIQRMMMVKLGMNGCNMVQLTAVGFGIKLAWPGLKTSLDT